MRPLKAFLEIEVSSGIVLLLATALALVIANSPLYPAYQAWLVTPVGITLGEGGLVKTLSHWINDGLMAIFFLLIGLEIKRELGEGELSSVSKALLPVIGAIGGVVTPALIYLYFNQGTEAVRGWAIPTATDIAFALGVVALMGSRLPISLKIFLMAVAVIDDLIAVLIIALFYKQTLDSQMLLYAAGVTALLTALNLLHVSRLTPYLLLGALLWYFVLKSGVHATVAGVVLGLLIPLQIYHKRGISPSHALEHMLHPWVAYGIMPLFALANAGVPLAGLTLASFQDPLPLGIMLGLFLGKPFGIFAFSYAAVRLGLAKMPAGAGWPEFYATCMIAGIGFTMSLFLGGLAFTHEAVMMQVRLGVLAGSLASAGLGYALLRLALRQPNRRDNSLGI